MMDKAFEVRLTDMWDSSIMPQMFDKMVYELAEEKERYVIRVLSELKIDKDVLKNQMEEIRRLNDLLQKYKDLEEQGLLLRLPCKVGDAVYNIESKPFGDGLILSVGKGTVYGFEFETEWVVWVEANNDYRREAFDFDDIGKTVFLTREEAEKKLKELGG